MLSAYTVLNAFLSVLLVCRRVALVNWRATRDAAKAARQAEAAALQDTQATWQVRGHTSCALILLPAPV
jgi:hypothetical protein